MTNTVSTDVKSLNDIVRDKVKETFVNLIPEDQWNELVKKCTDDFVKKELESVIKEELKKKMREKVSEELSSVVYASRWENGRQIPSQLIEMITKTLVPDIVTALMSGIVNEAVMQTANNLRNNNNRGY